MFCPLVKHNYAADGSSISGLPNYKDDDDDDDDDDKNKQLTAETPDSNGLK